MSNMNTSMPIVEAPAAPSKTATFFKSPAVRLTGTIASYLATAAAGWYFGGKLERAYKARERSQRGRVTPEEANAQSRVAQA